MKRPVRIALIVVAVVSLGIAASYPILYRSEREDNNSAMKELARMRDEALSGKGGAGLDAAGPAGTDSGEAGPSGSVSPAGGAVSESGTADGGHEASGGGEQTEEGSVETPGEEQPGEEQPEEEEPEELTIEDLILDYVPGLKWRQTPIPEYEELDAPVLIGGRQAAVDRDKRTGALPYYMKEKVELDETRILPELRPIYMRNKDMVGWLHIPDTVIDYPVVQCQNSDFYLEHDFYGKANNNGQIILDTKCDPYTPSYNLVISGHHMRSGDMFGNLPEYRDKSYWESHRFVEFDHLMERKYYVVIAAFYSADYDEDEEGFRYNADIQYRIDADQWLAEIRASQIYDTGIEAEFGDEFITLTTCDRSRRQDGRFVLILRKIREGEKFS